MFVPAPIPTQASIVIKKAILYKGTEREWSNRYFFGDLTTLDSTKFNNLADAIEAAEKLAMSSWVGFAEAIGYNGGSNISAFSKGLSGSGSRTHSSEHLCPGDCAALVRFSTAARTSKGHPIYLFKYFRGCYYDTEADPDLLSADEAAKLDTFGGDCVTGFSDGTANHPISGPFGATAQSHFVETYITHRDFPR